MIDHHAQVVSALSTVLPTHYELTLTKDTAVPCISYMEANNAAAMAGDTIGYSEISYQIKVWATAISIVQKNAKRVDDVMRGLGFKRTSSGELHDRTSGMIQKIMIYEALGLETY